MRGLPGIEVGGSRYASFGDSLTATSPTSAFAQGVGVAVEAATTKAAAALAGAEQRPTMRGGSAAVAAVAAAAESWTASQSQSQHAAAAAAAGGEAETGGGVTDEIAKLGQELDLGGLVQEVNLEQSPVPENAKTATAAYTDSPPEPKRPTSPLLESGNAASLVNGTVSIGRVKRRSGDGSTVYGAGSTLYGGFSFNNGAEKVAIVSVSAPSTPAIPNLQEVDSIWTTSSMMYSTGGEEGHGEDDGGGGGGGGVGGGGEDRWIDSTIKSVALIVEGARRTQGEFRAQVQKEEREDEMLKEMWGGGDLHVSKAVRDEGKVAAATAVNYDELNYLLTKLDQQEANGDESEGGGGDIDDDSSSRVLLNRLVEEHSPFSKGSAWSGLDRTVAGRSEPNSMQVPPPAPAPEEALNGAKSRSGSIMRPSSLMSAAASGLRKLSSLSRTSSLESSRGGHQHPRTNSGSVGGMTSTHNINGASVKGVPNARSSAITNNAPPPRGPHPSPMSGHSNRRVSLENSRPSPLELPRRVHDGGASEAGEAKVDVKTEAEVEAEEGEGDSTTVSVDSARFAGAGVGAGAGAGTGAGARRSTMTDRFSTHRLSGGVRHHGQRRKTELRGVSPKHKYPAPVLENRKSSRTFGVAAGSSGGGGNSSTLRRKSSMRLRWRHNRHRSRRSLGALNNPSGDAKGKGKGGEASGLLNMATFGEQWEEELSEVQRENIDMMCLLNGQVMMAEAVVKVASFLVDTPSWQHATGAVGDDEILGIIALGRVNAEGVLARSHRYGSYLFHRGDIYRIQAQLLLLQGRLLKRGMLGLSSSPSSDRTCEMLERKIEDEVSELLVGSHGSAYVSRNYSVRSNAASASGRPSSSGDSSRRSSLFNQKGVSWQEYVREAELTLLHAVKWSQENGALLLVGKCGMVLREVRATLGVPAGDVADMLAQVEFDEAGVTPDHPDNFPRRGTLETKLGIVRQKLGEEKGGTEGEQVFR